MEVFTKALTTVGSMLLADQTEGLLHGKHLIGRLSVPLVRSGGRVVGQLPC